MAGHLTEGIGFKYLVVVEEVAVFLIWSESY